MINEIWPARPYRGLKFYREKDMPLFREREEDVRQCAEALLGFSVKILVLQGSSGAGKSSFLRAGLIPFLKNDDQQQPLFLNHDEPTIRCTSDPVPAIANALKVALALDTLVAEETDQNATRSTTLKYSNLIKSLDENQDRERKDLAIAVADALRIVCSDLRGILLLVLDQAEECLIYNNENSGLDGASEAFFLFLQEIYLRNVDVRIVVSLRTEYYGRFRDELRISDKRLSDRPKRGGIEPYLLRPLREKKSLLRVLLAPTEARDTNGDLVYGFMFQDGVADEILADVLTSYPTGSVTPVLQVICAALYDGLTSEKRCITRDDFRGLKGVDGIMRDYVLSGVKRAVVHTGYEPDQWYAVLHSLVSRQGGGTVVSLTAAVDEIESRARQFGIGGDIRPALFASSIGWQPLLRGEPPHQPDHYSLQHDVLAVTLLRWKAAQKAEQSAKQAKLAAQEAQIEARSAQLDAQRAQFQARQAQLAEHHARRTNIYIMLFFLVLLGAFLTVATLVIGAREKNLYQAKVQLIEARNGLASFAPRANGRLALTLLLSNLDIAEKSDTTYEKLMGSDASLREETVVNLRSVLSRMPDFTGQYRAVGMEPSTGQIALLKQGADVVEILTIPESSKYSSISPHALKLPSNAKESQKTGLLPAVGFVNGIGPVAVVSGIAHYWNGSQPTFNAPDLLAMLPDTFSGAVFPRVEFVAGAILATAGTFSIAPNYDLSVRYLGASDIANSSKVARSRVFHDLSKSSFGPAFSLSWDAPNTFAYLHEGTQRPSASLDDFIDRRYAGALPWSGGPSPAAGFAMDVGYADADGRTVTIDAPTLSGRPDPLQRPRSTLAFVANHNIVLFKGDGPELYSYDLGSVLAGAPGSFAWRRVIFAPPKDPFMTETSSSDDMRLVAANNPWLPPPIAGVSIGQHLRAAWATPRGLWIIESSDQNPGRATVALNLNGPLISAEPSGTKLQFSNDGNVLVLLQQKQFNGPVVARIWDLRKNRRDWIMHAPLPWLRQSACRLVKTEGGGEPLSSPEAKLYEIDPKSAPCA